MFDNAAHIDAFEAVFLSRGGALALGAVCLAVGFAFIQ